MSSFRDGFVSQLNYNRQLLILAVPTVSEKGQLTKLLITNPDLFSFEELSEQTMGEET